MELFFFFDKKHIAWVYIRENGVGAGVCIELSFHSANNYTSSTKIN